ncbi:MAG: N-acetylmuramoyl-L-alanine amidase [Gammaproteobacteria bacterium]|nr:N-acetylmuramoyl-L-alanine amidase [Gammaproteobacteria bacterium]
MILVHQLFAVTKPFRWVLASLPLIFLLLIGFPVSAGLTTIESVRVRPSPERTRIVFDLEQPVEHKIFSLSNPQRLVIDINDAKLLKSLRKVNLKGTPILAMRSSSRNGQDLRVVLDLSTEVKPRSFVLKPIMQYGDRLVIDLYTNDQQLAPVVQKADRIARQMRDVVVAIDAGHGGDDPGAIGHGKLLEKKIVLSIANKLNRLFEKETGFRSILTRKGDYYVAHRKRMEIARESQADIFLSIHADAFKTAEASGASIYAISQQGATSEAARWLAEKENRADLIGGVSGVSLDDKDDLLAGVLLDLSMTASLSASLEMGESVLGAISRVNKLHKKHVEQATFLVLKSPDIPSLLIETGFISNPSEARKLRSNSHQQKMAKAIFEGVTSYMQENPPGGSFLAWKKQGGNDKLVTYIIVSGDTLSEIASKYRVSFKNLKKVNGLRGNTIRIGQILKIPTS